MNPTNEKALMYRSRMSKMSEKYAKQNGVEGLHPAVYHMYMSDFMKRWNESGEKVRVWTVNNEKDMKNFIENDLEAVITNYPDGALRVRREVTGC